MFWGFLTKLFVFRKKKTAGYNYGHIVYSAQEKDDTSREWGQSTDFKGLAQLD